MTEQELFTRFWTHETKTTLRVISRIPEGSTYRPDPKSRTAQEIAWQIVNEERMIIDGVETGVMKPPSAPAVPATMREVIAAYEELANTLPTRWAQVPADRWNGEIDFFGRKRPASPMAWSFLFDLVHHRGQITTYLRPMGSTVPQIYGPSGDEP
ncbi:hypothetical protein Strain138_002918 [Pseudogemmatithrix spongiicola]|uniref:DinB family protein n=1 Tax=Pseudogemmatithrix spongiicola TaxID=3062599 RepID=A0AA49JXA7_9BACT|nr:hypothetical protein Strain138_002918 [Gemmatimonadaceae bacterium 'strain 138']WKW16500.1 hypothetical protein Strain318_002916 [Gemmatimonadaceae bacterium 'strain 318']